MFFLFWALFTFAERNFGHHLISSVYSLISVVKKIHHIDHRIHREKKIDQKGKQDTAVPAKKFK